jgi:hypothetical protein
MRLPTSATAELTGDSPKSPVTDPERGGETAPLTRPARVLVKGFTEIFPSIGCKVDT